MRTGVRGIGTCLQVGSDIRDPEIATQEIVDQILFEKPSLDARGERFTSEMFSKSGHSLDGRSGKRSTMGQRVPSAQSTCLQSVRLLG
jgi:hypothetical protein